MTWNSLLSVLIFAAAFQDQIHLVESQFPIYQISNYKRHEILSSALAQIPSRSINKEELDPNKKRNCNGDQHGNALMSKASQLSEEENFRKDLSWKTEDSKSLIMSRSKRETTFSTFRKINTQLALQKKDVPEADEPLEALLKNIVMNHMDGCDLIIIFDKIFQTSKTLKTLVSFSVIKQLLLLLTLEDLSDKIEWESKNCQGTILLLTEPDLLISFGNINRFHWAYKAKVIIAGLSLQALEIFLKTTKGKKTEHIIGVVKDQNKQNFKLYMNLLFWGEGLQPITDWRGGRFTRKTNLFPDKVTDLRGGEVRVFVFEWRPIMFYERDSDGNVIGKYGRDLTIVRNLAKTFNYTLVFVDIEQDWGLPLPNGSFTGLAGYLGRDEGQMGLAYLYSTGLDDRHKVQDYSRPIEDDKGCFLTRIEAPLPPWQNPAMPFQPETWIAVVAGIALSGPLFYIIVLATRGVGEESDQFKSITYTSLFAIGAHLDQPLVVLPKRLSSQIFIVFLLIYTLILSTGYRSNLISFLTIARPPKALETFKDMYESGLPVKSIAWFYNALNHSGNPYLSKILDRYEIRLTFEEMIDEFMEGKAATINSKAYLEVLSTLMRTKKGKPLTRFLKECLSTYSVGIGFQWHTPLKPKFNGAIARLVESGIVRRWFLQSNEQYRKLVEKEGGVSYYPDIWHDSGDGLIPLGLTHMEGIFAVCALGYILSTITFAVEVIAHKV